MKVKWEYIIILFIVFFILYLLINRCCCLQKCNRIQRFNVGGLHISASGTPNFEQWMKDAMFGEEEEFTPAYTPTPAPTPTPTPTPTSSAAGGAVPAAGAATIGAAAVTPHFSSNCFESSAASTTVSFDN